MAQNSQYPPPGFNIPPSQCHNIQQNTSLPQYHNIQQNIPPPQYDNIQHNMPAPQYSIQQTMPPPQYDNTQPSVNINIVTVPIVFGEDPVRMVCPTCRNEIVTNVLDEYSLSQHLSCMVIFVMTAGIGVCLSCIPYCIPSLYNVSHRCPVCQTRLGTYKRCA